MRSIGYRKPPVRAAPSGRLAWRARAHAILGQDGDAESHYRQAIQHLGQTRMRVDLGRAHLVYGEWLRRQRRVRDARNELSTAHELLAKIGAQAFAERARRELRAAGAPAHELATAASGNLTDREALIARLARDGWSNSQIAGQLFISSATVAYHLRKVFSKLGITSRSQLSGVLPTHPAETIAGPFPASE
jgi:ATP/maltotriose-dependent transcriptional regulator MalT